MDRHLFVFINSMAGRVPLLDAVMLTLTNSALPALLAALGGLWWWPGYHQALRRINVTLVLLAIFIALGLASAGEFVYNRPRPYKELRATLLVKPVDETAFPSTHAVVVAAFAAALPIPGRRLRYTVWLLVFGVGVSRIYVGVHFPSDVVSGWILGWLSGALVLGNRDALQEFARRVVAAVEELF